MRNIMKNVLILGAGGQIARHVINQLADKQTIKQTLFARQPAKIHKPYPTNSKIIMGDVLNHAALKQAMQGQDVVYANLTGEDLDIQANSVIAAMKACDVKEGANKRGNSSRLTQSFHFFMFEPIFSPVNALNQPI